MKPTTGYNLGLADTHPGCKENERQALLKIEQDLIDDHGLLSFSFFFYFLFLFLFLWGPWPSFFLEPNKPHHHAQSL